MNVQREKAFEAHIHAPSLKAHYSFATLAGQTRSCTGF